MNLKARIIATTTSLAVVVSGLLLTGSVVIYDQSIADNELRVLRNASDQLTSELNRASRTSLELATAMSGLPIVAQSIVETDRALAARLLVPVFEELKGRYGYERFHLHTPPGINFFRAHNPPRFGDDDTAVPTIAASFRTGQSTVGLEGGEGGSVIAMRGSAPVMRDGRMIGLVQIGLGLSDSTLQTIQLGIDGDLRIQMPDPGGKWGVRAKTADLPQFHTADGLAAVLKGTPTVASLDVGGRVLASYAAPLRDFSGRITGVSEAIVDITSFRDQVSRATLYAVAVAVVVLAFSLLGGWLIGRSISMPVTAMTATMRELADGRLDVEIPASERTDEIGAMAGAVQVFKDNAIRNREMADEQRTCSPDSRKPPCRSPSRSMPSGRRRARFRKAATTFPSGPSARPRPCSRRWQRWARFQRASRPTRRTPSRRACWPPTRSPAPRAATARSPASSRRCRGSKAPPRASPRSSR